MVDKYAERIKGVYDLYSMPGIYPVPLLDFAQTLGYKVRDFVLTAENRHISGAVMYKEKIILLNPSEYEKRRNFTLAHELGHIILGHGADRDNEYDTRETVWNPKKDSREYEADELAAELLMPEAEFKKLWNEYKNVPELADAFEVSIMAAKKRLDKLGIDYER